MSRRERDGRKRSRSWSWSRSRSRSPAGRRSPDPGNGGGPFNPHAAEATSDPRTLDARVFVGSLTPDVTQEMLKKHFSKYGDVKGVLITRRKFGFVQFTSEQESTKCLADGPFAMVEGRKIDVKPAKIRRPGEDGDIRGTGGGRGWSGGREGTRGAPRLGAGGVRGARRRDYDDGRPDNYYHDAYYRDERGSSRSEGPSAAGYPEDYPEYYREYYDRYYRDCQVPPLPPRDYPPPAYPAASLAPPDPIDPLDPGRPNDLEIVVPNRIQRAYAESIEAQLRRVGLLVDILFPPSDVSSSRVLADLTSRRCLYAVTVTPDNEKHHSLTLNILHGTPQEHRNMPVDDALLLIQREFQEYVKQTRRRNSRETLPRDIRNLILDLLEARNLSMGDLDKLIKFLKERQNILVDDQIELKRETSGPHGGIVGGSSSSSVTTARIASSLAVTYPGYNYGGALPASSSLPPPSSSPAKPPPSSMAAVTYPGFGAAAATQPPSAPSGMSIGHSSYPPQQVQYPTSYMSSSAMLHAGAAGGGGHHQQQPPPKQVPELQDRILTLMKSNTMISGGVGVNPPVGVPPPVPAPTAVPPPMMHHNGPYGSLHQSLPPKHDDKPPSMQHSPYVASYQGWHQ